MSRALPAAEWPRAAREARLLCIDPRGGALRDRVFSELPELLRRGDLLVLNDASTLPASLPAEGPEGPLEVRLAGPPEEGADGHGRFAAVIFGAGTWRDRTEDRPPPPPLARGDRLIFAPGALSAEIVVSSPVSPRLVELRFDREDAALWPLLFRLGRPVQYSYLRGPLALWHVQTAYGARPWAMEMPSAGWPLDLALLERLRHRGIRLAALTHAAGLSSTGDPSLDAALPLPERSDIPEPTVRAVADARREGHRVVAVGTTVVRALEGRAREGGLRPGVATTRLRLGEGDRLEVVDGIVTGLHEPGGSHFALLQAFASRSLIEAALDHAAARGYLGHEFGDSSLILPVA